MGMPPVMETFVVLEPLLREEEEEGPGVEVRETGLDLGLGLGRPRSETRVPTAVDLEGLEGGGVADLIGGGLLRLLLAFDGVDAPDRPDM